MIQKEPTRAVRCGIGRSLAALLLLLVAQLIGAPPVHAHGTLKRSHPSSGEHLSAVPRELRFTFTEHVEAATARVVLEGPHGSVQLGAPSLHRDSASVLIVPITGGLTAGEYRVRWQIAGVDGHPVKGDFGFFIAPGATGLAYIRNPGLVPQPSTHHPAAEFPEGPGFRVESTGYVVIRWLGFIALIGTIGAVAFRIVLMRATVRTYPEAERYYASAARRTAGLGLWLALLVLTAAGLRLVAQSYALHGRADVFKPALVGSMVTHTLWGWGWVLQAAAGLLAVFGFWAARRGTRSGWLVAGFAAVALAFSPGLSGHAAVVPHFQPWPVIADGLHVLGAAGWLGALLAVLAVGLPATRVLAPEHRGRALAGIVNAYSPTAFAFAGLTVVTGVFASWVHLGGFVQLWQSAYGRTLLVKLTALAGVFATGAYNWLRVRPALNAPASSGRLWRSAAAEVAIGAVVLLVTAVLVAISPPQPR